MGVSRKYGYHSRRVVPYLAGSAARGLSRNRKKAPVSVKAGTKFRSARSRTVTRRRRRSTPKGDAFSGGVLSYQRFVFGGKKGKIMGKMGAPLCYQTNAVINTTVPKGGQGFLFSNPTMSNGGITALQVLVNNETLSVVGTAPVNTAKVSNLRPYITYASSEARFVNTCLHPVNIEIYDYVYRRDTGLTPAQIMGTLTAESQGSLAGSGGFIATTTTIPGFVPQDNSMFSQMCKIIRRRKIFLAAGEQHIHRMNAQYNKFVNPAMFEAGGNVFYKGYTFGCFGIIMGTIAVGSTSGRDLSDAEVCMYQIDRYHCRPVVSPSYPVTAQQTSVAPIVGTEWVVSEAVGQILKDGVGLAQNMNL